MMTVKQILSSGHEMMIQAKRVNFQPDQPDLKPDPALKALLVEGEDGETRTFASGTYFVMNDAGSTVAKYYLGAEPQAPAV